MPVLFFFLLAFLLASLFGLRSTIMPVPFNSHSTQLCLSHSTPPRPVVNDYACPFGFANRRACPTSVNSSTSFRSGPSTSTVGQLWIICTSASLVSGVVQRVIITSADLLNNSCRRHRKVAEVISSPSIINWGLQVVEPCKRPCLRCLRCPRNGPKAPL